jgi:Na+/H+-dicarboxylate symporter
LAVLVGVGRFMSERPARTNFTGDGVTNLVAARGQGALDRDRLSREAGRSPNAARLEVVEDLPTD